jgi:hypothetical protein
MRLLTAKLCARRGMATSILTNDEEARAFRKLMYGRDYAKAGVDEEGRVALAISGEEISAGLENAAALIVVCDKGAFPEPLMMTAFENAPNLEKVLVLSRIGVSKAQGGFFSIAKGENKDDVAMRESEQKLRAQADKRNLPFTLIRVGELKGGGPGQLEGADRYGMGGEVAGDGEGEDLGLAKTYYDSLLELETAMMTQDYDKFTLGCKATRGDTVEISNPLTRFQNRGSFDPQPDETSRIVAGEAVLAALAYGPVEFTVSSAEGRALPTEAEWRGILDGVA